MRSRAFALAATAFTFRQPARPRIRVVAAASRNSSICTTLRPAPTSDAAQLARSRPWRAAVWTSRDSIIGFAVGVRLPRTLQYTPLCAAQHPDHPSAGLDGSSVLAGPWTPNHALPQGSRSSSPACCQARFVFIGTGALRPAYRARRRNELTARLNQDNSHKLSSEEKGTRSDTVRKHMNEKHPDRSHLVP